MWCCRTDIHILYVEPFQQHITGNCDRDEKDADDDVECTVVWSSVEWNAMGGCGIGFWRSRSRGCDSEKGEGCERESEREERIIGYAICWHLFVSVSKVRVYFERNG